MEHFGARLLLLPSVQYGVQVLLGMGDRLQMVGVHQRFHHGLRQEGRQRGAQIDVLDAQCQQRQQDAHRLLLVPGQHQRQRQFVDGAAEGLRQCQRDLHGTVGIVALAHVQYAGDAVDVAQIQVIEPELAAGQRQYQRVHGCSLHKVRVVVPSRVCAVAAAHEEDVLHRAAFDGVDHRRGAVAQGVVGEARGQDVPTVDAAHAAVGGVSAQRQRLVNDRRKVLPSPVVLRDVPQPRIPHHGGGVDAVGVAGPGRHQAVGREQNRGGQCIELLLLVLPSGAEVAGQMGVLL